MTHHGIVQNGSIVLADGVSLPEGAHVEIIVKSTEVTATGQPTLLGLLEFAGTLHGLPADFAAEHDHYIHGTPKRAKQGDQ